MRSSCWTMATPWQRGWCPDPRCRSCSRKMVEAAGIEPGQLDDLGAVSPRHLAQVRDPPREMGGPRALSRVANRHPAGSVDQRDHGGPEKVRHAGRRKGLRRQPEAELVQACGGWLKLALHAWTSSAS